MSEGAKQVCSGSGSARPVSEMAADRVSGGGKIACGVCDRLIGGRVSRDGGGWPFVSIARHLLPNA